MESTDSLPVSRPQEQPLEVKPEVSERHLKLVEDKRLKALKKAEELQKRRDERDARRLAKAKAEDAARDERRKLRDEKKANKN